MKEKKIGNVIHRPIVASVFVFVRQIRRFLLSRTPTAWAVVIVITLILMILLRNKHPWNLIMLWLFTIGISFAIGLSCSLKSKGDLPKVKPKNAAPCPDGNNYAILGDIGDGKPLPQDYRHKAHVIVTKPKVSINPKPEDDVIDSSSGTCEGRKQRSREKIHTLTSLLSARSKAASGVTDILKEAIPDIDASDAGDELSVVEYIEDIYKFYKHSEEISSRTQDYMDSQVEINPNVRAIVADWVVEVHNSFELMPESLYLTFYILDRYLSMKKVVRKELQLVGISAMLIACKYEEIRAPEVDEFICISGRAYSREKILAMEKEILNVIEWNLTVPTPYVFLVRFVKAAICDKEMENMVYFFAELGLLQYSMTSYCPSMVAASSVYAARCTLKKSPLWTETLKRHTGFSETQLGDCAKILVKCHASSSHGKQRFVYKKYSCVQFGAVAKHSPALQLLEEMKATSSDPH